MSEVADLEFTLLVGEELHEILRPPQLRMHYENLLRRHYGVTARCSEEQLRSLLSSPTELVVFVIRDRAIVATAQATFINVLPQPKVLVHNLIVADAGQNRIGEIVMTYLLARVKGRWGQACELPVFLMSKPHSTQLCFYQGLGFRPHVEQDLEIVWEKMV
ncbi:MAG TPA: hypothetical protein VGE31_00205 [Candidatus Paceibacterota bacterium]